MDKIAFTGSTEVGKKFLRYASESNMKQVSLECGGKSPQVVMDDSPDLETIAASVAFGIFYDVGQTCHAGSRLGLVIGNTPRMPSAEEIRKILVPAFMMRRNR